MSTAQKRGTRRGSEEALSKYEVGDVLGQGSFAVVKSATRKSDGARFAMKLVDMEGSDAEEIEHERAILTLLGLHRHIVSLVDSFVLPGSTAFVMELVDGGEVFDKICAEGAYSEADAADVVRQVCLGLAFIHEAGVMHRDLKPENLLLTSSGIVKLADFGLAARCGRGAPPLHELAGTASYLAPEILRADKPGGPPYGAEADLFSLGCVLFALLGAYVAFDPRSDGDNDEVMARIERGEWSFDAYPDAWRCVSPQAKALVRALLEPNPSKRMSADAVLQSRWVAGEGPTHTEPLPGSGEQLKLFNEGRRVWRQAAAAAAVFAASPLASAHSAVAGHGGGKRAKGAKGVSTGGMGDMGGGSSSGSGTSLPPLVQAELRSAFANFDLDGDGTIDAHEMRHAIRALGAPPGEAERLIKLYDVDNDGKVDFNEFTALVQPLHDDSANALRAAFDLFDTNHSGDIDRGELSVMLRKLGFEWQGAHIFESADIDGDGRVDFTEFSALFGKAASAAAAATGRLSGGKRKGAAVKRVAEGRKGAKKAKA